MDNNRAEAERWLGMAERLLASRDLQGTRTFAIRVRDFNPILADQILAVADTLLAAQSDSVDWYRILQLAPLTQSAELVATQYRKLALLLNPARNNILYADQAFRLVSDAWSVLSNPSKKAIYDNEVRLGQFGQASQPGFVTQLGLSTQLDHQPQVVHFSQQQHHQHQQQQQQQYHRNQQPPQPQPQPQQPQQQYQHQQQQRDTPTTPGRRAERVIQFGQPQEPQHNLQQQRETETPVRKNPRSKDGRAALEEQRPIVNNRQESTSNTEPTRRTQTNQTESTGRQQTEAACSTRPAESTPADQPTRPKVPSFWTACPYCYVLYEYPKVYEECTLRCQKCKRAFHAATIPSPPESGNATYFCCWGFFPIGCSGKQRNKNTGPRVYYDDDDIFVEISDTSEESEDDWEKERRRKRARNAKVRGSAAKSVKNQQSERVRKGNNLDSGNNFGGGSTAPEGPPVAESSRRGLGNGRRQMRNGAKDLGKLDLNVEFSNETEEPAIGRREGNGTGYGEEDNIEGNGFFEGLDEFLSTLPILSVVGDDKVKAT